MKIKNKGNNKVEILIYEDIGEGFFGGISAKSFADELKALPSSTKEINVRINSQGGSVFDGLTIYNSLVSHPARVTVDVDGLAASIASVIAMAGDEIRMPENSFMMIHDPWTIASGSAEDLRTTADLMDKVRSKILDTYVRRSSAGSAELSDMMSAETWLTAAEALEAGLIDSVTEDIKIAAHYDLTKFKHTPEKLATMSQNVKTKRPTASGKVARMAAHIKKRQLTASG